MADSRLPTLLLHGQVVGQKRRGKARTVSNNGVLSDDHQLKLHHNVRNAMLRTSLSGGS